MPSLIAFGDTPPVVISFGLALDALSDEINSPSATGSLFPFGRLAATAAVESDAVVENFDTSVDDIPADSRTAVDSTAATPDDNVVWTMADIKRTHAIERAAAVERDNKIASMEAELAKLRLECFGKGQALIRLNDSRPRREVMQSSLDSAIARTGAAEAKYTKLEEVTVRMIDASRGLEGRVVYLDGQVTYFKEKEREKSRKVDKLVGEIRGLREELNRVTETGKRWAETGGTLTF